MSVGLTNVLYDGSLTSGGAQTTATANAIVDISAVYAGLYPSTPTGYVVNLKYISITNTSSTTAMHVLFNGELAVHEIAANGTLTIQGLEVNKFTIQENGATYSWWGLY